jgi:hypothetical protein
VSQGDSHELVSKRNDETTSFVTYTSDPPKVVPDHDRRVALRYTQHASPLVGARTNLPYLSLYPTYRKTTESDPPGLDNYAFLVHHAVFKSTPTSCFALLCLQSPASLHAHLH